MELAANLIPKAAAGSPGGTETYSIESKPSLTAVLTSVAIASMGAFAFGYHLGVVNGPLAAIAQDLGFGGNAALQGAVSMLCLFPCWCSKNIAELIARTRLSASDVAFQVKRSPA